jgi:hypothetical protein
MSQTSESKKRPAVFRKHLLLPAEHGTWFWFFVPFFVGVGVAGEVDVFINVAVFLTFTGGFAAFLMRQPLTAWLQIRRGRGRRTDGPLAIRWTVGLGLAALACFAALLALGYGALLWLLLPLLPLVALYLVVARQRRAAIRTFWLEIAGGIGLALMAPAAFITAGGQLDTTAWVLWGLMAAQNGLGAHYVRLRLADTHDRPSRRIPLVWSHGIGLLAVILAGLQGVLPLLTAVPFAAFLVRAVWTAARPRPVPNVKRFGFTEVAVEIVSGLWIILSYRYPDLAITSALLNASVMIVLNIAFGL